MHGFFVVDKPAGMSSHDVVSRVRRLFNIRKVGHTGTLDPFATGVLPVAVGEGTKAIQFLDESEKEYRATARLGSATDTQDCTGTVISEGDWHPVTLADVAREAVFLTGDIDQVPPMFSALKRDGVPLYRLARRGEEVEREPRRVVIRELAVEAFSPPDLTFRVACSRGTYVRTLADDLGARLGCRAHLVELRRLRSGPFHIDAAVTLDNLAAAAAAGQGRELLVDVRTALAHLPVGELTAEGLARISHGLSPLAEQVSLAANLAQGEMVVLLREGKVAAVATWEEGGPPFRLRRVFNELFLYR